MADYYPLISKAIAGLDPSAPGESRRALYERARHALIAQLRSVQPPLSESAITRERLSLEEAVRKVESEAAQRAREAARGTKPPRNVFQRSEARSAEEDLEITRRLEQSLEAARAAQQKVDEQRREDERHRQHLLEEQIARAEQERHRTEAEAQERIKEQHRRFLEEQEVQARREAQKRAEAERRIEGERQRLSEIERATHAQDDVRRRREEQEAARVQKDVRRRVARAELAKVASPAPSLASDGRLDAGPNAIYDEPRGSDDLASLPIRQRAIIKTILSDLPGNSPKHLRVSLESYDDELKVRGAQPILGLLKDIFDIIEATADDPRAEQEWLEPGLRKAFQKLADNHRALVRHFPLDPEREELYSRILVDEDEATGRVFSEPFKEVAEGARAANKAGLATNDFLRIIDKMAEFAKIISNVPPPYPSNKVPDASLGSIEVKAEDGTGAANQLITPKKRILLSGFGFFERAYNLLGSTVTIGATPEGLAFLTVLREAIGALSKFLT